MTPVMKKMCHGCPFNYGDEATEQAYNYGCLPSVYDVKKQCDENGTAWACHSTSKAVCCGYAEVNPDRVGLPIQLMEGVHT